MKKITGWLTSDGKYFEDRNEAMDHELIVRQKEGIAEIIKNDFRYQGIENRYVKMFADFVFDKRDELLKYMEDEYILEDLKENLLD